LSSSCFNSLSLSRMRSPSDVASQPSSPTKTSFMGSRVRPSRCLHHVYNTYFCVECCSTWFDGVHPLPHATGDTGHSCPCSRDHSKTGYTMHKVFWQPITVLRFRKGMPLRVSLMISRVDPGIGPRVHWRAIGRSHLPESL